MPLVTCVPHILYSYEITNNNMLTHKQSQDEYV